MRTQTLLVGALAIALAAPLTAQAPTGTSAVGTQDPNWDVSWVATPLGGGGNSGGFYDAYVVNAVGGVWQPDVLGGPNWISAWQTSSAANGVGDYNGLTGAGQRYTYTFQTTFLSSGGTLHFSAGWDNIFDSFILNGTAYSPTSILTSATDQSVTNHFGFCRDGDGVFLGSKYPNCIADFEVGGMVNGLNTIQFVVRGDGQTDGLYFEGDIPGGPSEVTPEPGTMTLLATGLAGLSGMSIRRRRKRQAA